MTGGHIGRVICVSPMFIMFNMRYVKQGDLCVSILEL